MYLHKSHNGLMCVSPFNFFKCKILIKHFSIYISFMFPVSRTCAFFFNIDIELSYGDNCLVFLLASLRPVSSRPWPIFSSFNTYVLMAIPYIKAQRQVDAIPFIMHLQSHITTYLQLSTNSDQKCSLCTF